MTRNGTTSDLVDLSRYVNGLWISFDPESKHSQRAHVVRDNGWTSLPMRNTRTWDTVSLPKGNTLRTDLDRFLASEKWYADRGVAWTRGYLLTGRPGCGKTSVVKAMSKSAKLDVYVLNLNSVATDEDLQKLVMSVPSRCLLLIEDVDCCGDTVKVRTTDDLRSDEDKKSSSKLSLSCILNLLDGVVCGHGRITVMTSNHPEVLDPALVRPGRVDVTVRLDLCDVNQLDDVARMFFGSGSLSAVNVYHDAGVDLKDKLLSVAEVTGTMMEHQSDPEAARAAIVDRLKKASEARDM